MRKSLGESAAARLMSRAETEPTSGLPAIFLDKLAVSLIIYCAVSLLGPGQTREERIFSVM